MAIGSLPHGFAFASGTAGIKESGKPDLAIVVSDRPATACGMFTTNRVCAAPVQICRQRLPGSTLRGFVVNSGNANACTGDQGLAAADAMTVALAQAVGCDAKQILVASTGVIGRPLPTTKILPAIAKTAAALKPTIAAFEAAAHAIMTTDTRAKISHCQLNVDGKSITLLGFAKGAAMIGPNMATMLAFVLTDAAMDAERLKPMLQSAVDKSFHCISVEGHTSTNDTVLALANGASGVAMPADAARPFAAALTEVCQDLAKQIVADAEGASKFITLDVAGCCTDADAKRIAKTIAESALAKAAFFGNDPNWGRICSAAGYSGVDFAEKDMSLRVNGTLLYDRGQPTAFDPAAESARMKQSRDVLVELTFTLGAGHTRFWTCDLTTDYVHLNADYTT